jgi:hypothetical protein
MIRWFKRLLKRQQHAPDHEYIPSAPEPLFAPGDLVLIYDPYVLDGLDAHEIDAPEFAVVESVIYVQNLGVFAYKLEGCTGYYNEAWLHPALYGTKMIVLNRSFEAVIDDLLDEYNDYKRLVDEFGDEEYRARLAEIEAELIMLTGGERE